MKYSQLQFPSFAQENDLAGNLYRYWSDGLFDEYDDKHFLIRLFFNDISSIEWESQLVGNNSNSMYTPLKNGRIDYDAFSSNFLINFGMKLLKMEQSFGKKPIYDFISGQLAAGKASYDPNAFFQALSEIEILYYFLNIYHGWSDIKYEPPIGPNHSNPEACFCRNDFSDGLSEPVNLRINVEVKTPGFPILPSAREKTIVPTVLLSPNGRKQIKEYASDNSIRLVEPRITKIVEFLNSAAKKFDNSTNGDINLLFINWSYSDFPSNGFLEAWSLLTNEINGIFTHKNIGTTLPFKNPVDLKAYEKITAIIVYTDSLDQLMFGDFRYVFQRHPQVGPRFRVLLNEENANINPFILNKDFLFKLTGMCPSPFEPKQWRLLTDAGSTADNDYKKKAEFCMHSMKVLNIVEQNMLKNN